MKKQALVVVAMMAVVLSLASVSTSGQTPTTPGSKTSWTPPLTPDGHPDFRGVWQRFGAGMQEPGVTYPSPGTLPEAYPELFRRSNSGDVINTARRVERPTGIIDPPDRKLPWRSEAAAKRESVMTTSFRATSLSGLDPYIYCAPPAAPRGGPGLYRIVQTRDKVVLMPEYMNLYRIVPLDRRPGVSPAIRLWQGNARGHWDGNTLVIETRNYTGTHWYDMVGHIQSDGMRTIERFTLTDPDTIDYQVTIDDPKLYTKPWTTAGYFLRAAKDPDGREAEPFESSCIEGTVAGGTVENSLHAVQDKLQR